MQVDFVENNEEKSNLMEDWLLNGQNKTDFDGDYQFLKLDIDLFKNINLIPRFKVRCRWYAYIKCGLLLVKDWSGGGGLCKQSKTPLKLETLCN